MNRLAMITALAAIAGTADVPHVPGARTPMVPDGRGSQKPPPRGRGEPPKLAKLTRQARRRLGPLGLADVEVSSHEPRDERAELTTETLSPTPQEET